jgi:S1-C subfamily serine protease
MRFALLLVIITISTVRADDTGATVYKKVLPSVTWIHVKLDRGTATGSGTLIDAERRLVLTNYHVVDEQPKATIFFPQMRDGQPIAERSYYTDRAATLSIPGKVLARNVKTDLAIIQLERLPANAKAVPLSASSAEPGSSVHSIGNAGKSGALFGYVPGKVRQVYVKDWKADLGGRVLTFRAKVVETDSATNPGDSGGPLVNDKAEIVGVTEGGAINAQLISTFVDVSEVKKLLASKEIPTKSSPPAKPAAPRDTPTKLRDGAALLNSDTVNKGQAIINTLHKDQKFDVLIETFESVPAADLVKVKAMNGEDRGKYMKEWTQKRMAAEQAQGIAILICKEPRSFYVDMTGDAAKKFPASFPKALVETVQSNLKANKPSDAILKALQEIQASYGKN